VAANSENSAEGTALKTADERPETPEPVAMSWCFRTEIEAIAPEEDKKSANLEYIEGIGPVYAQLNEAGINNLLTC
jgi:predicted flap endonuclease-1-like 5' DNA nuclease